MSGGAVNPAAARYAARFDEARGLVSAIEARLALHAERQKASPENWGHAGDLARVVDRLNEVLAALEVSP